MNFALTDAQKAFQKVAADFAAKELAPTVTARYDRAAAYDRKPFEKFAALGMCGIPWSKELGGAGGDYVSYALAVDEVSQIDPGFGISLSVHVSLCSWPIYKYGTPEIHKKYLVPLAQGKTMGAFGLTEPNAGSDAAGQQTVAEDKGDHYLVNGSKIFNTNGGEADTYVVFVMTDKTKGLKGISALVMEKTMPGFKIGKTEQTMGLRSARVRELFFQDVKVPKENLLAKEGDGFKIAMTTLDGGRIGVAAQSTGIAAGALNLAINYTKQRVQFGKPISANQALQFMMADMAVKVDAARLLTLRAAWTKDNSPNYSKEAAMAKLFASDIAMEVASDAVQLYGGYGYTEEYPVERYLRDAKICQIYEGTNQVQRMVISGAILR